MLFDSHLNADGSGSDNDATIGPPIVSAIDDRFRLTTGNQSNAP